MQRWFWNSLPIVALGLIVYACVEQFLLPDGLVVVPSRANLGTVLVGEYQDVECTLHNHSNQPISFLGSTQNCNLERCIYVDDCPLQLAPRAECRAMVHIAPNRAGWFECEVVFFSKSPSCPRLTLKISGTAIPKS